MKVAIVGSGLAGVITANFLKEKSYVSEVVIISSSNIPPIGVGESSVPFFTSMLPSMGINPVEFLKASIGSVKQGVYYKGWTNVDYINPFINTELLSKQKLINLGNKPIDTPIKDYLYPEFYQSLMEGNFLSSSNMFNYAYHFDTNLAVTYLKSKAVESSKVSVVEAEVVSVNKNEDGSIESLSLSNSSLETADYYINATGFCQDSVGLFGEEYTDLSNVLPNNKAIALSLDYTDKQSQFHPYTEAKAMNSGWKWTIPTWDKLGVGYVFSTDYISVDDAKIELSNDLGLTDISPNVISFSPKKNENTFNVNHCSVGMSNNFLDPLDSPTLMFVMGILTTLDNVLLNIKTITSANEMTNNYLNGFIDYLVNQFKSCKKNDTPYWSDLKEVSTESLDNKLSNLPYHIVAESPFVDMISLSIAAKDMQFSSTEYPVTKSVMPTHNYSTLNHYQYVNSIFSD